MCVLIFKWSPANNGMYILCKCFIFKFLLQTLTFPVVNATVNNTSSCSGQRAVLVIVWVVNGSDNYLNFTFNRVSSVTC